MKKLVKGIALVGVGLTVVFLFFGTISLRHDLMLSDGSRVWLSTGSTWNTRHGEPYARVHYKANHKNDENAVLWQDLILGPITLIPGYSNVFFCLYEYDIGLRLLKIDPSHEFVPFSTNSDLSTIVVKSPWKIEMGSIDDWNRSLNYLKSLSAKDYRAQFEPSIKLGNLGYVPNRKYLIERLETGTDFTIQ